MGLLDALVSDWGSFSPPARVLLVWGICTVVGLILVLKASNRRR